MTDIAAAATLVPANIALQGNLDPILLLTGGPAMEKNVRCLLDQMQGRPFIFNLGHGVLQGTPPENVADLVALVRNAGAMRNAETKPIPAHTGGQ
jgi:uroporphyrinogen decarboxylase